jgi:ADP-ribose pyrophosphatase YjhB (NUDIX family)
MPWPPAVDPDAPRFCSRCGGRLTTRQVLDRHRTVCPRCGAIHYLNLKVAASTITRVDPDHVVLIQRGIEPGYGLWGLPGGFVERGETVEAGAARDTEEETGLRVHIEELVGVFSYPGSAVAAVVYAATPIGGRLVTASPECLAVRPYRWDQIPWAALAFSSSRDALTLYTRRRLLSTPPSAGDPTRAGRPPTD